MEAIHNGTCQRHPLLLTPATTVSVTHAISSGKQPRSRTELVAYQSPFPSSSALEGPVHQADFFSPSLVASRLLGARPTSSLLTGLEGPRHPANQAVMTPWQNMGEAGGGGRGERGEGGKGEGGKRGPGPGPGAARPRGRPHGHHVEARPGCQQSPPSSHISLCRHRSGGLSVSFPEVMLPLIGPQVVRCPPST